MLSGHLFTPVYETLVVLSRWLIGFPSFGITGKALTETQMAFFVNLPLVH